MHYQTSLNLQGANQGDWLRFVIRFIKDNLHSSISLPCSLLALFFLCFSLQSQASYNANAVGEVLWIKIYNDEKVTFALATNQPTHTQYHYFMIRPDSLVSDEARARYYAMLLSAKAIGAQVTVGYDNTSAGSIMGAVEVYALEMTP